MATATIAIEATAKKKATGKKRAAKKATKKSAAKKGPGVIDSIVEFLTAANAKAPLTKDELVKKLTARFKERDAKALRTTVNCQLGQRIEEARKLKVHKTDDGYYITSK